MSALTVVDNVPPTFTVFTPTYNRAETLPALYASLCRQTYQKFEWLIVDGGNDNTHALVRDWSKSATFSIRYLQQRTTGLHGAYNEGAICARGELFLTMHSDDSCVPETLEHLRNHWTSIPASKRNEYSGIWARCIDQSGEVIGRSFGVEWLDTTYQEMTFKRGMDAEMFPLVRTDVMREFPFPMLEGVRFVPEGFVWRAIGAKYKTRFIDTPLRKYYVHDATTAQTGQLTDPAMLIRNASAIALYCRATLTYDLIWAKYAPLQFLRLAASYVRYSLHANTRLVDQLLGLPLTARALWSIALPIGVMNFSMDRVRARK